MQRHKDDLLQEAFNSTSNNYNNLSQARLQGFNSSLSKNKNFGGKKKSKKNSRNFSRQNDYEENYDEGSENTDEIGGSYVANSGQYKSVYTRSNNPSSPNNPNNLIISYYIYICSYRLYKEGQRRARLSKHKHTNKLKSEYHDDSNQQSGRKNLKNAPKTRSELMGHF